MAGKLPPIPGELPTLNDWENHLTTIFPEVPYVNRICNGYGRSVSNNRT